MFIKTQEDLFNWTFSQFAILQLVKSSRLVNSLSLATLLWTLLLVSVVAVLTWKPDSWILSRLLFGSFIAMSAIDGSLSNHVVTSTALAVMAVFITSEKDFVGIKWFCAVLYLVTGLHKLNSGFFDRHHSCASLYVTGSLSVLPLSVLEGLYPKLERVVRLAPYCAVSFELVWPFLLTLTKGSVYKLAILVGAMFHAALALPPSPLSVYPFSAIMVPLYVVLVPGDSLRVLINRMRSSLVVTGALLAILVISSTSASMLLFEEINLFEYPPYGLWGVSVAWNCIWWTVIVAATIGSGGMDSSVWNALRPNIMVRSVVLFLLIFALTPYVGLRNYPALAMFSNLRTEGSRPNHWVPSYDFFGYQRDWVRVTSTNFGPVRDLQINLGHMFPAKLLHSAATFNVSSEFYICPPTWESDIHTFVPFNTPFIEIRRRVSSFDWAKYDSAEIGELFIEYERYLGGSKLDTVRFSSFGLARHSELTEPLSWFEKYLVRFRTFSEEYSPCRH